MNAKQQQEGNKEGDAFGNAAWEANVYNTMRTYQVNAVGLIGFSSTDRCCSITKQISQL